MNALDISHTDAANFRDITYGEGLSGTNLERAGDHNQRVTLQAIRANGPITRTELTHITGLTPPAIANITRRLVNEGLVMKVGRIMGGRGQPATRLMIDPNGAFSIGLNIDRDHLTLVALDFIGEVRARFSLEIPFASPTQVLDFTRNALAEIRRTRLFPAKRVLGLGVSLPDDLGSVKLPNRPENYAIWSKTNMAEMLGYLINAPIMVENDAAAAAIGEMQFGHGLQNHSFIYTLISAGLGGGLVINGAYYRGAQGRSGEIGFLPIQKSDGQMTTLQDEVSLSALYQKLAGIGIHVTTPKDLETLSSEGQAIVDAWIEDGVSYLYMPFLTLSLSVNPDAHYIGGRLPAQLIDRLCDGLNARFLALGEATMPKIAPIKRAAMSDDACAIGAAILPFNEKVLPNRDVLMKSA
jgi:predicted NBD/HSP70 family sugar kinase